MPPAAHPVHLSPPRGARYDDERDLVADETDFTRSGAASSRTVGVLAEATPSPENSPPVDDGFGHEEEGWYSDDGEAPLEDDGDEFQFQWNLTML